MSDTDIVVGQFGLRTFCVDRDGHLRPISGTGDRFDWQGGVAVAECRTGGWHRPPADGCACGIYSFASLEDLQSQYPPAQQLVAVIAPEGRARIGQNGLVSERARVIAVWTRDERLTSRILAATDPAIRPYTDLEQMVSDYGLRFTAARPATVELTPRSALRSFAADLAYAACGVGWRRIIAPVGAAILLHLLAGDLTTTTARAPHGSGIYAVRELIVAADRAVLAAGHGVTAWIAAYLMALLLVALIRVMWRRRAPTAADGRLLRHHLTDALRKAMTALVFVSATYLLHGRFPGADLIGWTAGMLVAASWASGGTIYHLTHTLARRAQHRHPPAPIGGQPPTLRELLAATRRNQPGQSPA